MLMFVYRPPWIGLRTPYVPHTLGAYSVPSNKDNYNWKRSINEPTVRELVLKKKTVLLTKLQGHIGTAKTQVLFSSLFPTKLRRATTKTGSWRNTPQQSTVEEINDTHAHSCNYKSDCIFLGGGGRGGEGAFTNELTTI